MHRPVSISLRQTERHHFGYGNRVAHQTRNLIRNLVRSGEEMGVGSMHISRRNGVALVAYDGTNCSVRVAKVGPQRCKGVPEDMWRYI